jgi:hypothetical protein
MKIRKILSVLFIASFIISCNEENPALVNPPSKAETVWVRFINLGVDQKPKKLVFEGSNFSETEYSKLSKAERPKADSAMLKVFSGDILEYAPPPEQQVKFLRNTNYTFIGLSSKPAVNKIDTLIALRTSAALPDDPANSLVKFCNAFHDTNVRYSIRMGCPNGEQIFSPLLYTQYSLIPQTMLSGSFSISLVKTKINDPLYFSSNLYQLNLNPSKQYALIVTKDIDGNEKLLLLDENETIQNQLIEVAKINDIDKKTEIRTINLSSSRIDVSKDFEIINTNLNSMFIDNYQQIEVCNTTYKELIITSVNGITKPYPTLPGDESNMASLEVGQKYSLVIFDVEKGDAGKSLLIEPIKSSAATQGKAVVRVVNAAKNNEAVTVSLGARKGVGDAIITGTILADTITFGNTSKPCIIDGGIAPICVFTSSQPSKLLYPARGQLENDKTYLLIIFNDENGNIAVTLIEDSDEGINVKKLDKGVFLQLVNAYRGAKKVEFTINPPSGKPILDKSQISYFNDIATVIEEGTHIISVPGSTPYTFEAKLDYRLLIVISGLDNISTQIFLNPEEPVSQVINGYLRYRFINASDIKNLKMKEQDADTTKYIMFNDSKDYLLFTEFSDYMPRVNKDIDITYYFYDENISSYILRLNGVPLVTNKSYSIIITGIKSNEGCLPYWNKDDPGKEPNCYDFIVIQEF